MAGGEIFEKTISGGTDKCLIIDPNYAYQVPLTFGSDWTKIKLGMFLSYTNSTTAENTVFPYGVKNSGGTTNDSNSYIGFIKNQESKYLPLDASAGSFIGHRFSQFDVLNSTNAPYSRLLDRFGTLNFISTFQSQEIESSNQSSFYSWLIPFWNIDAITSYMQYVSLEFEVFNKGQSNQYIAISPYTNNPATNALTDSSLIALENLINGGDSASGLSINIDFFSGGAALDLPDSFYFYNAFLDCRPRIHAWAVKKIS